MTKLTLPQICFLIDQGIPMYQVFDATGIKTGDYKRIMKELGMAVAIGVTPCKKAGHTLRDSGGHCLQCGTHNIAFRRRYHESGTLYVARSENLGLTKIGTAKVVGKREYTLNNCGYGGSSDWKMQFTQHCDKVARVELEVHQILKNHNVSKSYWKQDNLVDCSEIFDCEVELAIKAIEQIISQL